MKPSRMAKEGRGAALLVVVAIVVLIAVAAFAYLRRVPGFSSGRSYPDNISTRQLADSAVGVIISQIREATATPNGAWASQPGMIRVYRSADGQPGPGAHAFYKLYSSNNLLVSQDEIERFAFGKYDPSDSQAEVPLGRGGWRDQPAYFVDLNEPADVASLELNSGGKKVRRYPIFDPTFAGLRDPAAGDEFERAPKVEGLEIALPPALRDRGNEAPMPVRWIYVLRDGTLTTPTPLVGGAAGAAGRIAQWKAPGQDGWKAAPSKANPVVGRIGFWADDDTSKVNINTAAGFLPLGEAEGDMDPAAALDFAGSYWDTPRMQTVFDRGRRVEAGRFKIGGLANAQPAPNEFQRYPGHPATTSLGLVFANLLPRNKGFDSEKLYAWLPRTQPGGSMGGTFWRDVAADRQLTIKSPTEPDENGLTYRFFHSVDDMLYAPQNGPRVPVGQALRLPEGVIPSEIFDRLPFVLTAHSRASELNLFGRPRVTIWPVWNEPRSLGTRDSRNSPLDDLIRASSTIGGREFLFAREKPYSGNYDFYLPRNRALFGYLRKLTSRTEGRIPGFGGSFEEKFTVTAGGRDQILTEIFDYIRTMNLKDVSRASELEQEDRERSMYAPRGIVMPTRAMVDDKPVAGLGRYATISEASLVFYFAGMVVKDKANPDAPEEIIYDGLALGSEGFVEKYTAVANLVRAFLVFETFNPMHGYASVGGLDSAREVFVHEVTFDSGFAIQSPSMPQPRPLGFRNGSNRVARASGSTWGGRSFGGTEGFFHTLADKVAGYDESNDEPGEPLPKSTYPFASPGEGVRVPAEDRTFAFSGGKLTLRIKFNADTVQTVRLDFPPAAAWPMPTAQVWPDAGGFDKSVRRANPKSRRDWASFFERRLSWVAMSKSGDHVWEWDHSYSPWEAADNGDGLDYANRWRNLIQPGDTVRSLVPGSPDRPQWADLRVVALTSEPGGMFRPHPDYPSAKPRANTLRRADGVFYLAGADDVDDRVPEKLVNPLLHGSLMEMPPTAAPYAKNKGPDLPLGVTARRADGRAADFDTGLGNYPDGAFAGKVDEGNVTWRWMDEKTGQWTFREPYFSVAPYDPSMDTFFSANRQVPSPVVFGSLPSSRQGWETLLFCPNPAGEGHPGMLEPRDHLLLDLFTMPVVEPQPYTEAFSTAGKVNLNYAIAPFGYLKRTTALRAALHSLRVTAIPSGAMDRYKSRDVLQNFRYPVDRDETIKGFDAFFAGYETNHSQGFFKSASEVCDRYLYPKVITNPVKVRPIGGRDIRTFWRANALTGDNLREKPYADLYPRVTTKSNTYTVHFRVQTLRQKPFSGPAGEEEIYYRTWDESRDSVLNEYRGQTTIERYLTPQEERFKPGYPQDDRVDLENQSLEGAYRFRVVSQKGFLPR